MNAMQMTPAEYARSRRALIEAPKVAKIVQRDTDALATLHARHPEMTATAAAARTAAQARHRELGPHLVSATLDMRAAEAAAKDASRSSSILEPDQAGERLAATVALHDTVLAQHQAAHAAGYGARP